MNELSMATYTAPEYVSNNAVEAMSGVPRFGHTSDMSLLLSSDKGERTDYALGTIFVGTILFAIFTTWALLLLIFMFMGPRKVGFMAGFKMKRPFHPTKKYRTPIYVRSIFVFSCLVVIAAAIITCFVNGLNDLRDSTDHLTVSVMELKDIANEGKARTQSIIELGRDSANLRDLIVNDLRMDQFCTNSNLNDLSGEPINDYRNTVVQDLYDMNDFGDANFTELFEEVLDKIDLFGDRMELLLNAYGVKQWHVWFIIISFASITSFLMFGTILTATGCHFPALTCLNTWFLLPIFLVIVVITWSLLSLISVGTVMNADFCSGGEEGTLKSPDVTSMRIAAQQFGDDPDLLDATNYWISGCKSDFESISYIDDYVEDLNTTIGSLQTLATGMDNVTLNKMFNICGKDFTAIRAYLDLMTKDYDDLMYNATKTGDLLKCEPINSIYVDAVHDTFCTEAPIAAVWTVGTFLVMVFFAMVMITLRSSWLEVIDESEIVIPMAEQREVVGNEYLDNSYRNNDSFDDFPSASVGVKGEVSPTGEVHINESTNSPEGKTPSQVLPTKDGDDDDSHSSLSDPDPENMEQALDDLVRSDDEASGNFEPLVDDDDSDRKSSSNSDSNSKSENDGADVDEEPNSEEDMELFRAL